MTWSQAAVWSLNLLVGRLFVANVRPVILAPEREALT